MARPVLIVLLLSCPGLLLAQTASARRSVQPASSVGRRRRVDNVREANVASVGGPRPACGVHPSSVVVWIQRRPSDVQPSGVQPSGVQPSSVQRASTHLASTRPASNRLLSAPVRPDASVSSHLRRWRWGPGRCSGQPSPRERVEVAVGCRARASVSRGVVADPAGVVSGRRRPRVTVDRPGRPGRVRSTRRWRLRCGHGSRLQRELAAPAAGLLSWAGWATTVRGGRGARRPGGRAGKGRWACRREWVCGPRAAQAGSGRSRLADGSAVTCGNGWWACQDLNLGPHPER
jgi:hypothetical protein